MAVVIIVSGDGSGSRCARGLVALLLAGVVGTPAAAQSIGGRVFEDVVGDALADGAIGSAANPIEGGARVELFRDGGDGAPDGGDDTYQGFTVSSAVDGSYSFNGVIDGTYWVTVDSQGVDAPPYNPGYSGADTWAEQTYGPVGAASFDGVTWSFAGTAGPFYGGARWDLSDDFPPASSLATAEHLARVIISGASMSAIDFGFSFNVVTTTRGGSTAQDPGAGAGQRTAQGSLRQFLTNAAASDIGDTLRFVPAAPTNASAAGGSWWRIDLTALLPQVDDDTTIIDGRAYDAADGTTVLDTNPGFLGANSAGGVTVGVDDLALPQVPRPELELDGGGLVERGLDIHANAVEVRRLAMVGFDGALSQMNIRVGETGVVVDYLDIVIEDNVLGTTAGSFSDPGPGIRSRKGMHVFHADNGIVRNNLIGFNRDWGVVMQGTDGWTLSGNEIQSNGLTNAVADGIGGGSTNITITGNLIENNAGNGMISTEGTVENNTVRGNGVLGTELAGMALFGDTVIRKNVVTDHPGPGIIVIVNSTGSRITRNTFGANGKNSIDLLPVGATATERREGEGITPNTAAPPSCGIDSGAGNDGLDAPVIASAAESGGATTVNGAACAGATIEIYRAVADGDSSDTSAGLDYGEGLAYLGATTADGVTGAFSLAGIGGLSAGQYVSAIAIDGSDNTSEFGVNVQVIASGNTISGTIFEDVNYGGGIGRDRAAAAADAPSFVVERSGVAVELYDAAGSLVATTTTAGDGGYAFTGVSAALYTVRVVADTVTSTRPGSNGNELGVQVFRADGDGEAVGDGAKKVGGELPSNEDAAANSGAQTLGALQGTDLDTDGVPEWTQSIVTIDASGGDVSGVDFGFNFDTVVNTNDAGQGSLRQFMLNSNLLN